MAAGGASDEESAMKHARRRFLQLVGAAAAGLAVPRTAFAQPYPARPVRVIVPFAPGGTTDTFARLAAQKLSERLGKPFQVDNIVGGTGNAGTGEAARAEPDGHTVLFAFSSYVVNPTLFANAPYDPDRDFVPVTLAVASTHVFTVHPSLPVRTVKDLIALIQSSPGKYDYTSGRVGMPAHLLGEQFRLSLGLNVMHVPFDSTGPAIEAVVAGRPAILLSTPVVVASQIKEGKLRALAVTSTPRSPMLPEVPTLAEAGYPDIEGDSWVGVLVPAGTPKEIITLLNRETVRLIALPDVKQRLLALGFAPIGSTPDEFATRIKAEIAKWARVIRQVGIEAR
jgi:tripartite-type tricarboxylate transporter receptor subunit TctC